VSEQAGSVNYPDILGAVTGGARLNVDVVQCAAAARPAQVPAGQVIELVLVLQNAADIDVDVTLEVELPKQDLARQKDRFIIRTSRLLIGLRPAEAGMAVLPVAVEPNTRPGPGYAAVLTLKVKPMARQWQRVRLFHGGGPVTMSDLPAEIREQMAGLRSLRFSVEGGKKDRLVVPFAVLPAASANAAQLQARYQPLWTLADYIDEYALARRVWQPCQAVLQRMKRDVIFMPLLKATQDRFEACAYPLLPPEAIVITKLLTLVSEMGVEPPTEQNPRPSWPRWFVRLCRVLAREPAAAGQVEALVTQQLWGDIAYTAVLHGFAMITNVTREDFGTTDEIAGYAQSLVATLEGGQPVDFARAYLPLALGGLIANSRVTMPREQVRDTVHVFSQALDRRRAERTENNAFVYEIADALSERALDAS